MKLIALTLVLAAATLTGCSSGDDPNAPLGNGSPTNGGSSEPAKGVAQGYDHTGVVINGGGTTGGAGAGTGDDVGAPVASARFHGCTKITYAALGSILTSRGVASAGTGETALDIYQGGIAALGVASYSGRVPESLIGTTSSMAKQFDIFIAAAAEMRVNLPSSTACLGVTLVDAQGKLVKDGLSCLMGKLASDDHVAVANQAVADAVAGGASQDQAVQIAISALLEAAHTCE